MVSTRSVREKVFLMVDLLRLFLWSVAVVMTKRPLEKAGAAFKVFNDM